MKTKVLQISKIVFFTLFVSLITISCSSGDSNPTTDEQQSANEFSVLINGQLYTVNDASIATSSSTSGTGVIATTQKSNEKGININVPSLEVGTYITSNENFNDFNLGYTLNSDFFISNSGTLTITENTRTDNETRRVKGNFSFSLVHLLDNDKNVIYELTEGNFDIEYLSFQ